jgi:hypothetical protein
MSTPNDHNLFSKPGHDPVSEALGIDESSAKGSKAAGYELSDANISGIIAFLGVLVASLGVFFVFCFALGKLINHEIIKFDGPPSTWVAIDGRNLSPAQREVIVSNYAMQQEQLSIMTKKFPTPRLQLDDGNQDTADMHSKEDLLLNYYSYVNKGAGTVRIPIDQAMALIAKRGLPVVGGEPGKPSRAVEPLGEQGNAAQSPTVSAEYGTGPAGMAGVEPVAVTAPLTDGFARTGWEQEVDEQRHQQLESKAAMAEAAK